MKGLQEGLSRKIFDFFEILLAKRVSVWHYTVLRVKGL